MKIAGVLALLLAALLPVRGQGDPITLADIVGSAQAWAEENLDTNVLAALPDLSRRDAQQVLREIQDQFQGDYVVRLASFKDAAETLVPWLESQPETRPYAAWLKARLDYLQVASVIKFTIPPPEVETNGTPEPIPIPAPPTEEEIWLRKVAGESLPPEITNYLVRLKPVFIAQKVPPELFWLAEVESDFDADACSPAGAVGLFQLKPETARRFGLSLSPLDQRLQPENNARASAQYLKYLYNRFRDWRLALAGYNAGENAVQKLLDRYHARSYDEIARRLPVETQMYVPRVDAILQYREGVRLTELRLPPDSLVRKFQGDE